MIGRQPEVRQMSTKILMTIVATMMLLLASTDTFAQTCTITPTPAFLQPNTEYFGNSSGTFKISVTGGCDPTPTINAPWITIYAQGATYVRLLVADNTGTVARQTTVTVAG